VIAVLIPVFNDWHALGRLLPMLDRALAAKGRSAQILIVDDGSTEPRPRDLGRDSFVALHGVRVLSLRRNLGHQRAIAVGLSYLCAETDAETVVVMDGDGEDDPSDVPALLERYDETGRTQIVFAERIKRSESALFRVGYFCYRYVHLALTGLRVRVGNFSVVPRSLLRRLVIASELWNHYAATVFRARLPFSVVPTSRANRLDGRAAMDTVALVAHGLSAMAVHGEVIGIRLLIVSIALAALALASIGAVIWLRLFTDRAVPMWAGTFVGASILVFLNAVMLSLIFSFTALGGRQASGFIPERDYRWFVDGYVDLPVA
jgi:glycosyltransferase involved in cell wall biosynthesis